MIRSALCPTRHLLLACLLAVAPAPAWAQGTPEQQRACAPDAMRLCMNTIPDVGRTKACMQSHLGELSPTCRSMFVAATGEGRAPAARAARREELPTSHVATREERRAPAARRESDATASRQTPTRAAPTRQAKTPVRHPRVEARAEPRDDEPGYGYAPQPYPRDDDRADAPYAPGAALTGGMMAGGMMPGMLAGGAIPREAYPAMAGARAALVTSCRAGLIDPYTCQTLPGLGMGDE